jgi:DNA-binding SARP family transcriptional activator/WD40 repeat protein
VGIGFLGPLQVGGGVSLRPRTRTVLEALGVLRGEVVSADRLAEAVWGDAPPQSWAKQVQICIWDLRKTLGADVIQTVEGSYRLAACGDQLDVDRFETLIDRGRAFAATAEAERAASTFSTALGLWRGRPFEDLDGWMPGQVETARLEELRRTTQEDLLEARLAAGEHRDVVAAAEARVAEEPLRERRWALLALAQYRSGNQGDALRTLKRARHTLVEEIGVDPGPDLAALEMAILGHDPSLDASEPGVVSARCPYKGLASYDVEDTGTFFGRDGETAACVERMGTVRLLVLAGPSGCGKSSLVRAGIVPVLRQRHLAIAIVVPGADPDASLSAALAGNPGHPIVVVDQLEELFAGQLALAAIRSFCARLASYAVERAPVVVTIRSDHLGSLAAEPTLARLVEDGLHLVTPLTGQALRATIEGPAAAAGLRLEPGLVELLVRETEDEPGALPLLSHALAETWERRDGRVLTVDGYRATGGIRGAVARSAEQLYQSLPADQQDRLRALLLRLVSPASDGEPIRAHLDKHRLDPGHDRDRVLDLLVRARLVTADDTSVQLAHEAVARAWPRLQAWLDEDVAGLRHMHHLSAAADEWDHLGRPSSELYRGARLASVLEWRESTSAELTRVETDFLDASREAAESERLALVDQARRQARQNRRLRWALAAVAAVLVVAVVAGAVAVRQRERAQDERREAALSALVGNALTLRSNRRDLAALLAVEAYRLEPSPAAEAALFGTFTAAPGAERAVHTGIALSLTEGTAEYAGDGRTIALGDGLGAVHLIDLSTGEETVLSGLSERPGWPLVDVAAGGRYLAAAWRPLYEPETGLLTVWDLETRRQRFEPVTIPFRIGDVDVSEDGSTVVASGGREGRALIFDGATGELRTELPTLPRPDDAGNVVVTAAVAFAPDGRLAVGSQAGPIRLVDPMTGREDQRLDGAQETSQGDLFFSSDGETVVATGAGMERFALETGEPLWDGPVSTEQCNSYAVAERIGAVLCGEWSGRVVAFDLETGAEIGQRFDSQLGDVCALAISPDGNRLAEVASCSRDDVTVVEWRLDGGGPVSRLVAATTGERSVEQFNGNALVATYPDEGDGPSVTHVLDGTGVTTHPGVYGLRPAAEPDLAVALYDDGEGHPTVGLYDIERRAPAGTAVDPGIPVANGWSDGRLAMVVSFDEDDADPWSWHLRTIDLAAGEIVEPTLDFDFPGGITTIAFGDDEFYAALFDQSDEFDQLTIQRRDLATGAVLAESEPGYRNVALGGGVVVAATVDGHLAELDPETLEPVGAPFPGTNGAVGTLGIDDSGRRLMVRADDDSLRFYDIPTRTQLGDPIDTDVPFASAALRADGMAAAAVTGLGIVTWDLDPARWEEAACVLAGRNLTREEWDQYIGDLAPYGPTCADQPAT